MIANKTFGMSPKTVYLAGLISTEFTESLLWRIKASPILQDLGFHVLSPMRGKEELALLSKDGGVTDPRLTPKDIMLRDYNDVVESDIILMHLDSFGSTRPLLGTIVELGWAWQLKKPIVAIASDDNTLMRTHPFVREAVAHYFSSVEEAIDFTSEHYGFGRKLQISEENEIHAVAV